MCACWVLVSAMMLVQTSAQGPFSVELIVDQLYSLKLNLYCIFNHILTLLFILKEILP